MEKEKIILLATAAAKNWKPKKIQVDAIATVSKMEKAESNSKNYNQ